MANHYGISAAARKAGVAGVTLQDYDRRGIIHPQRDSAGQRLFTDTDIARVREYVPRNGKR
jgi:DNA-binding transcriptional MerR regulator